MSEIEDLCGKLSNDDFSTFESYPLEIQKFVIFLIKRAKEKPCFSEESFDVEESEDIFEELLEESREVVNGSTASYVDYARKVAKIIVEEYEDKT